MAENTSNANAWGDVAVSQSPADWGDTAVEDLGAPSQSPVFAGQLGPKTASPPAKAPLISQYPDTDRVLRDRNAPFSEPEKQRLMTEMEAEHPPMSYEESVREAKRIRETPIIHRFQMFGPQSTLASQVAAGTANVGIGIANWLQTQEALEFFASAGLGGGMKVATYSAFLGQMAKDTPELAENLVHNIGKGDVQGATQDLGSFAAMYLAGKGIARDAIMTPDRATQTLMSALDADPGLFAKDPTEQKALVNRVSVNRLAPGTMRSQEIMGAVPPQAESPAGMVQVPGEAFQRPEPRIWDPRFEDQPVEPAPSTKEESETRGKVSFGAEAPTLLRNVQEVAPQTAQALKSTIEGTQTELTAVPKQGTLAADESKPNVIQTSTQEKPGINRETEENNVAAAIRRQQETANAWLKTIAENDPEASANAARELRGSQVGSAEQQKIGAKVLGSADLGGQAIRASGGDVTSVTEATQAVRARSSQERGRTGQPTGEPGIDDPLESLKAAWETQGDAINEASRLAVVKASRLLQDLSSNKEQARSARDLLRLLQEEIPKLPEKDGEQLRDHIYASIRQRIATALPLEKSPGSRPELGRGVPPKEETAVPQAQEVKAEEVAPSTEVASGSPGPVPDIKTQAAKPDMFQDSDISVESGKGIHIKLGETGESGFINLPDPILHALDRIDRLRRGIAFRFRNGDVIGSVAYLKDRGRNAAAIYGNAMGNDIDVALRQALGQPSVTRTFSGDWWTRVMRPWRNPQLLQNAALGAMVESGLDRAELARMRDTLTNAQSPVQPSRARAQLWNRARAQELAAIEFAERNFDVIAPVARRYNLNTSLQQQMEANAGIETPFRKNYVMHAQDVEGDFDLGVFSGGGGGGDNVQFRKFRDYPTYADSIVGGIIPKSLDAVDLMKARLNMGQRAINNRAWVRALEGMTDANGTPMGRPIEWRVASDGRRQEQTPRGYKTVEFAGQRLNVLEGFDTYFRLFTEPSAVNSSPAMKAFITAAQTGKHFMLAFDTFHLGRLGAWATMVKGSPTYRQGLNVLDYSESTLRIMAARGEIPQSHVNDLLAKKARVQMAIDTGYNIGGVSDNLYSHITQELPFTGAFNRWLFEQYQRGAMMEAWDHEFQRQRTAFPTLTESDVARKVSRELNTRFGNLMNQSVFKSKTFKDLLRLVFLAPQWNEGLIRSEWGAAKGLIDLPRDSYRNGTIAAGALLKATGTLVVGQFIANQLINYVTRGHSTMENKEEGVDAKLSAWIPDVTGSSSGLFISPLSLPFETAHLLLKRMERTGSLSDSVRQYLRSRLGVAARPLATWATKRDVYDRPLRPEDYWKEVGLSAIPAPISAGAFTRMAGEVSRKVLGGQEQFGSSQQFPGQYQKQALASMGLKTETVPSPESRMHALAADFNQRKGVKAQAEFFPGDYARLTSALRINNTVEARKEMTELLKSHTAKQVKDYFSPSRANSYERMPFTRNQKREGEFFRELTPEQQQAYKEARSERLKIAQRALKLLPSIVKESQQTKARSR